jgi:hypothetical protein
MKKLLIVLSLMLLASAILGTTPVAALPTARAASVNSSIDVQPVHTTPDGFLLGPAVPNAYARLVRTSNGITTNVHTTVSSGGGVYSLWWVIFNNPSARVTYICTFDDPDIVVNATAHIVPDGVGNLSASLRPGGPYSGEVLYVSPNGTGTLTNPEGALVLLVLRYHGPADPSTLPDQFVHYLGGCPDGSACTDEQLAVFPGDECTGNCADPSALP